MTAFKLARNEDAYGVLAVREDAAGLRFSTPSHAAGNARLGPGVRMLRALLAHPRASSASGGASLHLLQFDDFAHFDVRSTAFGRSRGRTPLVEMICDPYFYFSQGFSPLRTLAEAGALPAWSERRDVLFWRGSSTNHGWTADGDRIETLDQVPRVAVASRLLGHAHADVKLSAGWLFPGSAEAAAAWLQREGLFAPPVSMTDHALNRFQLDIDGVSNAWSTLERLLGGSCVLKVESPFEMWFYDRLRPWEHFVPVRPDGGDVEDRLDWCLAHDEEARAIAQAGQALALEITFERAVTQAAERLAACCIPLGG